MSGEETTRSARRASNILEKFRALRSTESRDRREGREEEGRVVETKSEEYRGAISR